MVSVITSLSLPLSHYEPQRLYIKTVLNITVIEHEEQRLLVQHEDHLGLLTLAIFRVVCSLSFVIFFKLVPMLLLITRLAWLRAYLHISNILT